MPTITVTFPKNIPTTKVLNYFNCLEQTVGVTCICKLMTPSSANTDDNDYSISAAASEDFYIIGMAANELLSAFAL
jgi:hypothetical protein